MARQPAARLREESPMRFSPDLIRSAGLHLLQDPTWQTHPRLPFAGLEAILPVFDLLPVPPIAADIPEAALPAPSPAFKNLDLETLLLLRRYFYSRIHLDFAARWAETLMRFCELRLPSLQERARQKWGTAAQGRQNMLEVGIFLLDAALVLEDLRFLNTALKLSDLKWLFSDNAYKRRAPHPELAEVWQWRFALVSHFLLERVEEAVRHG